MEKRLLLTRSRHDIANDYLFIYCDEILQDAENLGWKTDKVENEKNTKEEIESRISKTKPNFVFFNGHGSEASIHGHDNEKLVDISTVSILANKIVFARSCSALKKLGKQAVSVGCQAFVGYSGEFLIPRMHAYESRPKQDPLAKPVMEVSNLVGKLILKGDNIHTAVDNAQKKAGDLILKMLASDEPYHAATFRALYQNYSTLSFEGDPEAKIS